MQSEGRPQGEISGRNPNEFVLFAFCYIRNVTFSILYTQKKYLVKDCLEAGGGICTQGSFGFALHIFFP